MSSQPMVVSSWNHAQDGLPEAVSEALQIGREIALAEGCDLHWLILGPLPEGASELAGQYQVSALHQADDPKLEGNAPDAWVSALAAYCEAHSPRALLVQQTLETRIVASRLASRIGAAAIMNGMSIGPGKRGFQVTASAYGGDTRVVYEVGSPAVIGLLANAVIPEPKDAAPVAVEAFSVDLSAVNERIRVVEQAQFDGPRLDDAEIIVSGGRGLGGKENYRLIEQLAKALGGLAGASRPIVDEGWVDSSHQVGLTGRITRPNLYLAIGISGASQHMAGCSAAKTLVAVNRDPEAAIFQYARYGIVGDALEILPELIDAAQKR